MGEPSSKGKPDEASFDVQINQIDHYMTTPGELDNSPFVNIRVPVLRIYGPTSLGKKACVYIHQVYPYFYVEYTGNTEASYLATYIAKLQRSLNHAIAISMKRDPHSLKAIYIRAIIVVKGVHFYGFHSAYSPFLKVYMCDPSFMYRAVSILQSGTVMQTRFRVFESHLSYPLQFMCDFGLYGCGWLELGQGWVRGPEDSEEASTAGSSDRLKHSPYHKQTRMSLEVDAIAPYILNRRNISIRDIHHKLEIPATPLPNEPLLNSVRELWEDERSRRLAKGLPASPDLPSEPSEHSRGKGGHWTAEVRWWHELRRKLSAEPAEYFNPRGGWIESVMTTSQSIEALWEAELRAGKPKKIDEPPTQGSGGKDLVTNPSSNGGDEIRIKDEDVDVDESFLSSQAFETEEQEALEAAEMESFLESENMQFPQADDEDPYDQDVDDVEDEVVTETGETNPFVDQVYEIVRDDQAQEQDDQTHYVNDSLDYASEEDELEYRISPSRSEITSFEEDPITIQEEPDSKVEHPSGQEAHVPLGDTGTEGPTNKRRKVDHSNGNVASQPIVQLPDVGSEPHPSRRKVASSISLSAAALRRTGAKCYVYAYPPPAISHLVTSFEHHGLPTKLYREPYYSLLDDAPARPREYAGLVYHLKGGEGLDNLHDWQPSNSISAMLSTAHIVSLEPVGIGGWEFARFPPSRKQTKIWLLKNPAAPTSKRSIEGPTQAPVDGVKASARMSDTSIRMRQDMSILSLEVFAPSCGDMQPNPKEDEIVAVFFVFQPGEGNKEISRYTILVECEQLRPDRIRDHVIETVPSELDLLHRITDIVVDLDPDILTGWDVQAASWGYLNARGGIYGIDVDELVSRAPLRRQFGNEQWNTRHASTFKVAGRHVLNLWRIVRSELTLNMYTFENATFNVLRRRLPYYTAKTLTKWYNSLASAQVARLLAYFMNRAATVLEILEESQTITRTAEFARVFGVDFFSVITRGSQFKVESFIFRLGKPENFVFISPSKLDVGRQNAAECMPLIMEPLSAFYTSPLLVLDFQSLYPSIMIAYNYCYSTCLGRITDFQGRNKFGVTELNHPPGLLNTLQDHIRIAPNGIMYVTTDVRKGLLGRMLKELLETRVMVKQALKTIIKDDKILSRVLNARQLGLKYIANVTYGYTGATFSGRMPAVEIADSIVQSGRETLEKAIQLIDTMPRWGAKVVYGDTDSVFVYLNGKTREQAFRIGHDIADTITAMNPVPIKLKFEKVYLPCVLLAKKRYVGFKYEHPDELDPVFDAKGIETVRRDGVPAQQKMTEICIKKLFRSQDLSEIKEYCCRSWTKILDEKASLQDFIFAKEVKMGTYSDAVPPPGAAVAARRTLLDPNYEAQYGDRVPYLITRGLPGQRLVERAFTPHEVLEHGKRLDAEYYITRILIPPLERIFNLVGADVRSWYDEMPKPLRMYQGEHFSPSKNNRDRFAIVDHHFQTAQCLICQGFAWDAVCEECKDDAPPSMADILDLIRKTEKKVIDIHQICATCTSAPPLDSIECESLDCPWLYERKKAEQTEEYLDALDTLLMDIGAPASIDVEAMLEMGLELSDGEDSESNETDATVYGSD